MRIKQDQRGVSNILVVMLSLVIIIAITSNVILWSYQMNQLDWEKMREDIAIVDVTSIISSNWSYNPSGYTLGGSTSWVSGSVSNLTLNDGVYMTFRSYYSGTDTSNFVDNNTSDVDSLADKGTHSNFTAQQYGPDLINDTLTEENTGGGATEETLRPNAAGTYTLISEQYPNSGEHWDKVDEETSDGDDTYVRSEGEIKKDTYNLPSTGASGTINSVTIYINCRSESNVAGKMASFWTTIRTYNTDYDGATENKPDTTYTLYSEVYTTNPYTGSAWTVDEINALEIGVKIGVNFASYEGLCTQVYCVVNYTPANYELDLEVQWTSVDYDETNEYLCIYGGIMGSENVTVDVWNGSGWENLFTNLNSGWNNVSVSSYLTSSNFTIRFKGGNETGDDTQDSWDIDVTLLHVWSDEYTSEVEFTGSSNTEDWSQLNWTVNSAWTISSVNVTLQLYNHTLGGYPTSGNGYIAYTSHDTPNTDETRNQTISVNPTLFRNGTGHWKMKVKGVKATDTQFDFKADWIEFKVLKTGGTLFTFKNEGPLTSHLVSLWIINSTVHQRYDLNLFVNSAETLQYVRADISLPEGQYTVKVVTERGNIATFSESS